MVLESGQTAVSGPVLLLPPPPLSLSLRLGGEEVHRVFRKDFLLSSELGGHCSEEKLPGDDVEKSSSRLGKFVLCVEASGGWRWLSSSHVMVRGSGFMILQTRSEVSSLCLDSSSIASLLKMTLKCVFSEGVMVKVRGSGLSFLLTWMQK